MKKVLTFLFMPRGLKYANVSINRSLNPGFCINASEGKVSLRLLTSFRLGLLMITDYPLLHQFDPDFWWKFYLRLTAW